MEKLFKKRQTFLFDSESKASATIVSHDRTSSFKHSLGSSSLGNSPFVSKQHIVQEKSIEDDELATESLVSSFSSKDENIISLGIRPQSSRDHSGRFLPQYQRGSSRELNQILEIQNQETETFQHGQKQMTLKIEELSDSLQDSSSEEQNDYVDQTLRPQSKQFSSSDPSTQMSILTDQGLKERKRKHTEILSKYFRKSQTSMAHQRAVKTDILELKTDIDQLKDQMQKQGLIKRHQMEIFDDLYRKKTYKYILAAVDGWEKAHKKTTHTDERVKELESLILKAYLQEKHVFKSLKVTELVNKGMEAHAPSTQKELLQGRYKFSLNPEIPYPQKIQYLASQPVAFQLYKQRHFNRVEADRRKIEEERRLREEREEQLRKETEEDYEDPRVRRLKEKAKRKEDLREKMVLVSILQAKFNKKKPRDQKPEDLELIEELKGQIKAGLKAFSAVQFSPESQKVMSDSLSPPSIRGGLDSSFNLDRVELPIQRKHNSNFDSVPVKGDLSGRPFLKEKVFIDAVGEKRRTSERCASQRTSPDNSPLLKSDYQMKTQEHFMLKPMGLSRNKEMMKTLPSKGFQNVHLKHLSQSSFQPDSTSSNFFSRRKQSQKKDFQAELTERHLSVLLSETKKRAEAGTMHQQLLINSLQFRKKKEEQKCKFKTLSREQSRDSIGSSPALDYGFSPGFAQKKLSRLLRNCNKAKKDSIIVEQVSRWQELTKLKEAQEDRVISQLQALSAVEPQVMEKVYDYSEEKEEEMAAEQAAKTKEFLRERTDSKRPVFQWDKANQKKKRREMILSKKQGR